MLHQQRCAQQQQQQHTSRLVHFASSCIAAFDSCPQNSATKFISAGHESFRELKELHPLISNAFKLGDVNCNLVKYPHVFKERVSMRLVCSTMLSREIFSVTITLRSIPHSTSTCVKFSQRLMRIVSKLGDLSVRCLSPGHSSNLRTRRVGQVFCKEKMEPFNALHSARSNSSKRGHCIKTKKID